MHKRILSLLLCLMLALPCIPALAAARGRITILVYMCGSDLESEDGSGTSDLKELQKGLKGSDGSVRVLLETGGAKKWRMKGIEDGALQRHELTENGITATETLSRASMGKASTLSDFIRWGFETAPAEQTWLILWDHGGGPVFGFGSDELYSYDAIELPELAEALSNGIPNGERLALIGFDACLMGSIEVASVVAPHADYLLASEEMEPGDGWSYTDWLATICSTPGITAEQAGRSAVQAFVKSYSSSRSSDTATLSLMDLSRVQPVLDALNGFGVELSERLDTSMSTVSRARADVNSFGEFIGEDASDLVDLLEFCSALSSTVDTSALTAAVDALVLESGATPDIAAHAGGVSVLVPYSTIRSDRSEILSCYSCLSGMDGYSGFVRSMISSMTGSSYAFSSSTPANLITNTASGSISGLWAGLGSAGCDTGTCGGLWDGLDLGSGSLWAGLGSEGNGSTGTGSLWDGLDTGSSAPQVTGSLWDGLDLSGQNGEAPQLTGLWSGLSPDTEEVYSTSDANPNVTESTAPIDLDTASQSYFSGSTLALQAVYALRLSRDDLDHLASAQAVLLGEKDGVRFEYGPMGETLVDWTNGSVYSLFDGSWPTLAGEMATLYRLDESRAIIPATVGGIDMYLMVELDTGRITGATQGYSSETGLAARGLIPLTEGLQITLLHPTEESSADCWVSGGTLTVPAGGLTLEWSPVPRGSYLYAYRLTDIYNSAQLTDTVELVF